jgi:hypothetical protein
VKDVVLEGGKEEEVVVSDNVSSPVVGQRDILREGGREGGRRQPTNRGSRTLMTAKAETPGAPELKVAVERGKGSRR